MQNKHASDPGDPVSSGSTWSAQAQPVSCFTLMHLSQTNCPGPRIRTYLNRRRASFPTKIMKTIFSLFCAAAGSSSLDEIQLKFSFKNNHLSGDRGIIESPGYPGYSSSQR